MTFGLRSLPYRDFSVIWTFAPIRQEVLDRVEHGLGQVLRHPDALALRMLAHGRDPESFAADAVERTVADLGTAEALQHLQRSATADRPIRILVSRERITFAVSHAMFDGLALAELIAAVFAASCGDEPELDGRTPVRFSLPKGLRAVGRPGIRAWRDARQAGGVAPPPVPAWSRPGRSSVVELPLDAELADRITRLPAGGRSTPNARVASVALGALARVHLREIDVPVAVPVSLLRHVGNRRVVGNFVGIETLGALHSSDWSAAGISSRLAEIAKSGVAMVGLGYSVARSLRHAVLPKRRGPEGPGRVAVSMQMMRLPKLVPDEAWVGDERTTCAATSGPWPSATVLAPFQMDRRWFVTVWDESGDFDLEAYPEALLAELAERESAAALPQR